jgi:hypothetical protein
MGVKEKATAKAKKRNLVRFMPGTAEPNQHRSKSLNPTYGGHERFPVDPIRVDSLKRGRPKTWPLGVYRGSQVRK